MLLPLFFFLHGLIEYYNPVLISDVFILTLFYCAAGIIIAGFFWQLFKDFQKASLTAFLVLAVNFFFGSAFEFLKRSIGTSFFTKYSVLLSVIFILLIILIVSIKRSKQRFLKTAMYLNLLFFILIVIDIVSLTGKIATNNKPHVTDLSDELGHNKCDTCPRPDIYMIIADEYAGKQELQDIFSFNDSSFESALQQHGFNVLQDPSSNYNATVYSMASLLNMDYISGLNKQSVVNHGDMLLCKSLIRKNNFTGFLRTMGYNIYDYSFFDLENEKKVVRNYFFPTNRALLTYQTLAYQLVFHLGPRFVSQKQILDIKINDLYNNRKIDSLCRLAAIQKNENPKFVYAHFNLPHHPFFFDSKGRETPTSKLTDAYSMNKDAYIEYLQYANQKFLSLIEFIQRNSKTPPVIILVSDHGYRQLPRNTNKKYYFMNFGAISFPTGNYNAFYKGISNVNLLRVTLNSLFNQRLPLLKDSTNFLTE